MTRVTSEEQLRLWGLLVHSVFMEQLPLWARLEILPAPSPTGSFWQLAVTMGQWNRSLRALPMENCASEPESRANPARLPQHVGHH